MYDIVVSLIKECIPGQFARGRAKGRFLALNVYPARRRCKLGLLRLSDPTRHPRQHYLICLCGWTQARRLAII